MRVFRAGSVITAAIVVLGATAAGCGNSSDHGGGAQASASAPMVKSATAKLTGKPVKLAAIDELSGAFAMPGDPFGTSAKVAADYINTELGGFGGRPVQIVECDSKTDPGATLACANQTAAQGVAAQVGFAVFFGPNGLNVYKRREIPSLNPPVTAQDLSASNSFPLGGGSSSEYVAQGKFVAQSLKAKNVVWLVAKSPTGQVSAATAKKAFMANGGQKFAIVEYPPGAPDLTSAVAKAVGQKPDIIMAQAGTADSPRLYQALAQQGWPADKIINQGGAVDNDDFFSKASDVANGGYFSYVWKSYDDTADKDVATYRKAMEKYAPKGRSGRGSYWQWGFANVMMAYQAAKDIGFDKFDGPSFLKYLSTTKGAPIFMGDKYARDRAPKDAPAIGNPSVGLVQYKDGKLVDVSHGWIQGVQ